jgi:CheY-like chemotaxis protein
MLNLMESPSLLQATRDKGKAMARLLVAEDDEAVRAFLEKAFELDGHEVRTAEDGAIALEVLAQESGASTCS